MKNARNKAREEEYCLVLSTAPEMETARRLAHLLVEGRWVACANLLPVAASIYRWEGKVEESSEVLLLMKTVRSRVEGLLAEIRRLHPYECPEGIVLPIESGLASYFEWIQVSTKPEI
jgi:periplasmic divalent cation tolerance protein